MRSDELVEAMELLHQYPRLIAERAASEAVASLTAQLEQERAKVAALRDNLTHLWETGQKDHRGSFCAEHHAAVSECGCDTDDPDFHYEPTPQPNSTYYSGYQWLSRPAVLAILSDLSQAADSKEGPCIFPGCVSTDRHSHGGFPGGSTNPADPTGPPIPFTTDPEPGVRDYNGALLSDSQEAPNE